MMGVLPYCIVLALRRHAAKCVSLGLEYKKPAHGRFGI